jgi:hypothetical protein
VSGKVAKKEHAQIVEVLKYIQGLPPGLYGMNIDERVAHDGEVKYEVTLVERKVEDLRSLQKYDRVDEKPFEAVAAISELFERAYSLLVAPVRARRHAGVVRQGDARLPSAAHAVLGDLRQEPDAVAAVDVRATMRSQRRPRADENDNVALEKLGSECIAAASTSTATCATRRRKPRSSRCTAT